MKKPSSTLFKNKQLEKISMTNALFVVRFFVFFSLLILIYGYFTIEKPLPIKLIIFLSGIFSFTFIEYMLHRFAYHSGHDYKDGKSWQYKIHGVHHTYPKDRYRIAMPLALAILLATVFYLLFYFLMSEFAILFFPGFTLGYAIYLFIHFEVHTKKPPENFLSYLWTHHHLHHHKYEDKAFGVSSPLWDFLLRTMPPKT